MRHRRAVISLIAAGALALPAVALASRGGDTHAEDHPAHVHHRDDGPDHDAGDDRGGERVRHRDDHGRHRHGRHHGEDG
jgi:hypothetical protein